MQEQARAFRAMNTDVEVIVAVPRGREADAAAALEHVERWFGEVEAALSRFRPDSELSQLNRASGRPFRGSPMLWDVVWAALEAARATHGLFDPTVLGSVVRAGSDRSFELPGCDRAGSSQQVACAGPGRWREVHLDPRSLSITLPPTAGLDLGGIAKGWTVDRAASRLRKAGFHHFAVNAGGDLYAAGTQADGAPWTIGIEDPTEFGSDLLVLEARDRAVATSSVARRRWTQDGHARHHLIDPRTGAPSTTDVLSATVVASSATRAEVLAKTALLLGSRDGLHFLRAQADAEGLLALANGRVRPTSGLLVHAA